MKTTTQPLTATRIRMGTGSFTLSQVVSTGFPALDQMIPGGGWPRASVIELICDPVGGDAINILLPTLAQLSQERRWIACIAPPVFPERAVLEMNDVDLTRLLFVEQHPELSALDFVERTVRMATCSTILVWADFIEPNQLSRLLDAARKFDVMVFLLRSVNALSEYAQSPLRLSVASRQGRLQVRVLCFTDSLNSLLILGGDQGPDSAIVCTSQEKLAPWRKQLRAVPRRKNTVCEVKRA